jgi:hypothetical protein
LKPRGAFDRCGLFLLRLGTLVGVSTIAIGVGLAAGPT